MSFVTIKKRKLIVGRIIINVKYIAFICWLQMAVEKMQGISRLEQLVEELSEEERAKELKQEKKRQKRKNRRKNKCGLEEVKSTNLDEVMILLYIIRDFGLPQSGFSLTDLCRRLYFTLMWADVRDVVVMMKRRRRRTWATGGLPPVAAHMTLNKVTTSEWPKYEDTLFSV